MPKKSSRETAESRKRRSSSTKDSRTQSEDVLLPPTPTASHLVASNPFDDPLPNNISPAYQGPPGHMLMHSPLRLPSTSNKHVSKGSVADWKSTLTSPIRGSPYDPAGNSGWRPSILQPSMYQSNPNISHPDFSRSGIIGGAHPSQYTMRESQNFRQANSFVAPSPHPPGPMKPGTLRRSEKLPKSESNIWPAKSRKKGKSADFSSAVKSAMPRTQESWIHGSTPGSKSHSSPPVGESVPPHSIPPVFPETCSQCVKEIKPQSDDSICCLASCKRWYHRTCTGLKEAAYTCLKSEELALWACDNCLCVKEIGSVRLRNTSESPSGGNHAHLLPAKS